MRKQPSTAVPLKLTHVAAGIKGINAAGEIDRFEKAFAHFIGTKHAIAEGNGTTGLYITLLAMKEMMPGRDEVLIPAYTVPVLTLAIELAGLKSRLVDVERDTMNMDADSFAREVTDNTLAVVPVHMFGFPCELSRILEIAGERKIFVIEDACQAPGASVNGKRVGSFGDAGFFSLCKGKNISTFHGGMVVTDNTELAERTREKLRELPPRNLKYRLGVPVLLTAFSFAMRPWFYGTFFGLIDRFKDRDLHPMFHPVTYNGFMAGVGNAIFPKLTEWNGIRAANGRTIMEGLADDDGLIMPRLIDNAETVCNHIPLVFDEVTRMEAAEKRLLDRGIDTGRMYKRPINHIYEHLGYAADPEPFPGAAYIAPRLLTLPTHPYLKKRDIEIMIEVVRSTS